MYIIKKSKKVVARYSTILAALLEALERVDGKHPLRVISVNGARPHLVGKIFEPVSNKPVTAIEYECGDQIGDEKQFGNMTTALSAIVKNCGDGESAMFFQNGKTIMKVVAGR